MAWIYPSDQWRIWRNGICLSPITRYCFFTANIGGSFIFQLLAHVLHFIALHDLTTILSESILTVCWRILSLWSAHHISMWCKRPGDGDCLVRGRSCDERFFVCDGRGLLEFFDKSVFLCLGRFTSFRRSLYWLRIRSILHWTNQPLDFMICLQSGGLML